jgi:endonuclease/exonuclease/phosphatase family metal-dependent hydrolase
MACRNGSDDTNDDDGGGAGGSSSSTGGGGVARDPEPLTVVNWNVKNLVDDVDDGEMFEDQDFQWEEHVSAVANVLNGLDADVIVLQEVEHTQILGAVVAELDEAYPFHQVIDANDPRGIDVGVIARFEPDELISHQQALFSKVGTDDPKYRYARDALEIRITFNERHITLFGVHYKSKENDDPDKRLAEAQYTRGLADTTTADDAGTGVIILGDFNDVPGSAPVDWSVGSDPETYVNTASHVPESERWTFDYQGSLELVDHQLASPLLAEMLDGDSVRILHGPEVEAASDHAPIIATYQVR